MKTDFIATAVLPASIQTPCILTVGSGDISSELLQPS